MAIPLFDLKDQHRPLEQDFTAAFVRVLQSGQYILGSELEAFERETAAWLDVPHAIGVSSGTDALLLALMALDIGPGDEVIVPAFTFFATAGCVRRLGAIPVFADICPSCYNLDPEDFRKKITVRTRAVIPVHLFGQAAEMDPLLAIARDAGIAVIEDAAQSFGARYKGKALGSLGDFGAFSFFPTKNLGTLGDAGLLTTGDDALAEKARILRVHGMSPKYHHPIIGGNFRMDALQAALLRVKLPHLENYNRARQQNAAYYSKHLSLLPGVRTAVPSENCHPATEPSTGENVGIILPVAYEHNDCIWNQYTLRVTGEGRRDALKSFLAEQGIGSEVYYPVPLHEQACFSDIVPNPCLLPVSGQISRECLSLPIFPELGESRLQGVVSAIADFLEKENSAKAR